jgi:hypothetical protein
LLKGARINKADCHVPRAIFLAEFIRRRRIKAAPPLSTRNYRRFVSAREGEREPTRKTAKQTRVGHVFN